MIPRCVACWEHRCQDLLPPDVLPRHQLSKDLEGEAKGEALFSYEHKVVFSPALLRSSPDLPPTLVEQSLDSDSSLHT